MVELLLVSLAAFILFYPQILEAYLRALDILNGSAQKRLVG